MVIIGSTAIKYYFPDFTREPKDLDYAVVSDIKKRGQDVEYLTNPVICEMQGEGYLSPELLYTLKMSHMFWDVNWEKHMYDIQFLKKKGCFLVTDLFYKLYDYWNTVHAKNKRSDLKMSSEDFFDNAVKCPHSHDYLHTLINPIPTYTKVLIGEVEVCESKFNQLSHEDKCSLVTEEVMVMAYERYSNKDYRIAYSKMLKKFIISHAPLWEAVFIIENYIELHKPKFNYLKTIENGLLKSKQDA